MGILKYRPETPMIHQRVQAHGNPDLYGVV